MVHKENLAGCSPFFWGAVARLAGERGRGVRSPDRYVFMLMGMSSDRPRWVGKIKKERLSDISSKNDTLALRRMRYFDNFTASTMYINCLNLHI